MELKSAARFLVLATALNGALLAATPSMPAASRIPTPTGWRREVAPGTIPAVGTYTVALPPEVATIPVKGIDSYVSEYRSKSLTLVFDFGTYGSSGVEDCRAHQATCAIGTMMAHNMRIGRVAYQVEDPDGGLPYRIIYTILVGPARKPPVGRISLIVSAECATANACTLADRIVSTIDLIPDT